MKIEFAKEKDLEEIQQILSESDLPYNDLKMRHLESFFIIRSENNIIAVIGAEICNSSDLLRSLAVLPDYRNRNFASQLLTYMESHLKTMKINMIYLLTTTADKFFIRNQYQISNRNNVPKGIIETEEFKNLCPETAICMVKQLD